MKARSLLGNVRFERRNARGIVMDCIMMQEAAVSMP